MRFTAIDVETANPDLASICQIGVVAFKDGRIDHTWQTLIDPEDDFDAMNVAIHGIDDRSVKGAPTFPEIIDTLSDLLKEQVVASHTAFDRIALGRATEKYGLAQWDSIWLDTAQVVRRTWPQWAWKGYGLANVASFLGIEFRHHDAHEDARAAGEILIQAMGETGLSLDAWIDRIRKPIDLTKGESSRITREGHPDGPLAGEVMVFTGALSMPRRQAADLAARAGCMVAGSVTKDTTLLVVGDQDIRRLYGQEKSAKHRKAEQLIAKGQSIRILIESDFMQLV